MQGGFRIGTNGRRRGTGDSFVPMINIVFLLLIFFLLSATIAPPDPFDMILPDADLNTAEAEALGEMLHVSTTGEVIFAGARGESALAAVASRSGAGPLVLRADAGLDGSTFAALLSRLSAVGVDEVRLMVRQP